MTGSKIKKACELTGLSLRKICELSGLKYSTLYNQIEKNREIPFSSVNQISQHLQIPLAFFSEEPPQTDSNPSRRPDWNLAEQANSERTKCCRAGFSVTTDDILNWYHKENGKLVNWEWFSDQIDLYHIIEPTDRLMKPIQIGKRSITAERLMLSGKQDFLKIVGNFDQSIIENAMSSHKFLETMPYVVTDETLDVNIKGQRVFGGYRKVTMRLTDQNNKKITGIFSKLTWLNSSQII